MKRSTTLLTFTGFALVATATAQQIASPGSMGAGPTSAQQGGRGASGGRGGGAPATNVRSNEQIGVNIDRFIGNPVNAPAHLSHGGLITHSILTAGNPYEPGAPGAVLEYR